jgi:CubicO group peptidase (beta-lactamase class C family)
MMRAAPECPSTPLPPRPLLTAVLLATALAPVAAAHAQAARAPDSRAAVGLAPAARDTLRATIRRLLDSAGVASVAVAVVRDGEVLWEEGFGYADIARRVPATPTTRYSIASITKPMTATAVMQLVEQGRVGLDRPIDAYLGALRVTGLAGDAAGATVGRVLSHTAGLPLHYRFYYGGPARQADVARTVAHYGRVMLPPGEVYSYSNLGYGMLGELVAAVGGTSYETFMRDRVFRPLGMTQTTIGTGAGLSNSAVRYDARHRPIPYYDFDHRGASAVYTSVRELVRFGMFHLKTRPRDGSGAWAPPLADSTIDRMQRIATPGDTTSGYGLGWFVDREFGAPRVRHTGGMPGVATVLSLYPEHGVAIVALSNQSSGLPGRIVGEIAAAVLPPAYAQARAAARASAAATASVAPPALDAPTELRGEWRGTVRTYDGVVPIVMRIDSAEVRVRLGDSPGLWALLGGASFRSGVLGGRFLGTMPTAEARRVPHVVAVSLQLRDGTLRGWAAAQATEETNDYSLSSYAELTRVPGTPPASDR